MGHKSKTRHPHTLVRLVAFAWNLGHKMRRRTGMGHRRIRHRVGTRIHLEPHYYPHTRNPHRLKVCL